MLLLVLTEKEGEGIKEICCGGYFLAEGLGNIPLHPASKASPQDEHRVERTRSRGVWAEKEKKFADEMGAYTLPRGVGLRKPHIITFISFPF